MHFSLPKQQSVASHKEREIAELHLADFIATLRDVLPKLITCITSPEVRAHPVWGNILPYAVPSYGSGVSLGHCIRPDVVLTAKGPRICELDFVASGRGYLLSGLSHAQQREVTLTFAEWYRRMGVRRAVFATASTTICREDADLFAACMRRDTSFDIASCNIDEMHSSLGPDVFVDRLFYRSEMAIDESLRSLHGCTVSTAEPFLDSKAVFALIHDQSCTEMLTQIFGSEHLRFLRTVLPETRLVSHIKNDKERARLAKERVNYVVKSADVETDASWGCRGTVIGMQANEAPFLAALSGDRDVRGKDLGAHTILQRYHQSRDFWQHWDAVVANKLARTRLVQRGACEDLVTKRPATKEVGARIGFYFLIDRQTNSCLSTPYGDMVLRQDCYVHGSSDALAIPVRAV